MKIVLSLLGILALGMLLLLAWPDRRVEEWAAAGLPALESPGLAGETLPVGKEEPARTRKSPPPAPEIPRKEFLLQVLSSENNRPLEHMGLYGSGGLIGQPSGKDGFLRIPLLDLPPFISPVVWGSGRAPLALGPGRPLPRRVHLQPADGSLRVRLVSATPAWKIIRSLLQARERPSPGKEAWEPRLAQTECDLLAAGGLPPGSYDLYVWIASPDGEIHSLSRPGVVVESGTTTGIELDASLPPAPEPDS
ncbi:MAG: hypothetical protein ACE5H3_02060 [Planctomycetota bacterium]